jgi:hypothetical protein
MAEGFGEQQKRGREGSAAVFVLRKRASGAAGAARGVLLGCVPGAALAVGAARPCAGRGDARRVPGRTDGVPGVRGRVDSGSATAGECGVLLS